MPTSWRGQLLGEADFRQRPTTWRVPSSGTANHPEVNRFSQEFGTFRHQPPIILRGGVNRFIGPLFMVVSLRGLSLQDCQPLDPAFCLHAPHTYVAFLYLRAADWRVVDIRVCDKTVGGAAGNQELPIALRDTLWRYGGIPLPAKINQCNRA